MYIEFCVIRFQLGDKDIRVFVLHHGLRGTQEPLLLDL